jgi:hypothetical protein
MRPGLTLGLAPDGQPGATVRRQLRHLGDGRLARRTVAGDLDLEPLSLADGDHLIQAEPLAGTGDRLALRIMDLRLQHHVHDNSGHQGSVRHGRRPRPRCTARPRRVLSHRTGRTTSRLKSRDRARRSTRDGAGGDHARSGT